MKKTIQLFLLLLPLTLYAQSERDIKLSGEYYYGEGYRDSLEKAKNEAREDLLYKISVTLKSSTQTEMRETDAQISQSYEQKTKIFSAIKLKGLNYIQNLRPDGVYKVIAFISKNDYEASMKELHQDIEESAKIAERAEEKEGLSQAVSYYYKTYLKTFLSPDAVEFESKLNDIKYKNIRVYLETKIKSYLSSIKFTLAKITTDPSVPDFITTTLSAAFKDEPVNGIEARYNFPENPFQLIKDGNVDLFYYNRPSRIIEKFEAILRVQFEENNELRDFHQEFPLVATGSLRIDFSEIVEIDFKVEKDQSGQLVFSPVTKNLSVSGIEWDLGNGVKSTESKVIHKFSSSSPKNISLTINGIDELKVIKKIDANGNVLGILKKAGEQEAGSEYLTPLIGKLLLATTYEELLQKLTSFRNEGKLVFGKSDAFIDLNNCYCIIVDPAEREVIAFLTPETGKGRVDLISSSIISNIYSTYRKKVSIWMSVN